jgi:hypothetical protein
MKKPLYLLNSLLALALTLFFLPGCAVVGGIFKAGVWVGVLGVVIIVGIILYIVSRGSGKN